jgi:hypothetical protein
MSTDATSQFFDHPEFDRRATVDEQGLPTAWFGAAESVPWPTPVLPEAVYLSFYGRGSGPTPTFRHSAEASLRLLLETGTGRVTLSGAAGELLTEPLQIDSVATLLPLRGPAVTGLLLETEGAWGLTVAWIPVPTAPAGDSPSGTTS